MAEAVIENRPPSVRFFCHKCNIEFEHVLQDYTCPFCAMGFIEKLEENSSDGPEHGNVHPQPRTRSNIGFSAVNISSQRDRSRSESDSSDVVMIENPTQEELHTPQFVNFSDFAFLLQNSQSGSGQNSTPQGPNNQPREPRLLQLVHHILSDDSDSPLVVLGGRGTGLEAALSGDHIMTSEELDTIMSQLLWQVESDGPPPLSAQAIESLPEVSINSGQANQGLQCSICWEQFVIDEKVRELSCGHLYHEGCIKPWLSLHATCPICRKSLSPPASNSCGNASNEPSDAPPPRPEGQRSHPGTNLAFLLRACGLPTGHSHASSNSSNSTNSSSTSNSSSTASAPTNTTSGSERSNPTAPQPQQRGSLSDLLNQLVSMSGTLALDFRMGGGPPIVTATNVVPPPPSRSAPNTNPNPGSDPPHQQGGPPPHYDSDMEFD